LFTKQRPYKTSQQHLKSQSDFFNNFATALLQHVTTQNYITTTSRNFTKLNKTLQDFYHTLQQLLQQLYNNFTATLQQLRNNFTTTLQTTLQQVYNNTIQKSTLHYKTPHNFAQQKNNSFTKLYTTFEKYFQTAQHFTKRFKKQDFTFLNFYKLVQYCSTLYTTTDNLDNFRKHFMKLYTTV
jgi:hypothetical protein